MRLRKLTAAAALLLCAAGASACQSKAGAAAFVGGHRIADSDVSRYVQAGAKTFQDSNGATVVPKDVVLEALIDLPIFERAVATNGGPPSAEELATGLTEYLSGGTEAMVSSQLTQNGLKSSFTAPYIRRSVLLHVLVTRLKITQTSDLVAAVRKVQPNIEVSPRYGTWDAQSVSLSTSAGGVVPSFISLSNIVTATS